MTLPIWAIKAWLWLRANWKWLLLPVGILLWVLGKASGKTVTNVVAPELVGAAQTQQDAATKAAKDLAEAAQLRDIEVTHIDEAHDAGVHSVVQAQENKYEELKDKPEDVNSFLTGVGKDIRKG